MSITLKKELSLPYEQEICVKIGTTITLKGYVKRICERFAINLASDNDDNIPFHFNPRQTEATVVRNTKTAGKWEKEERDQPCFPFDTKQSFEIMIIALEGYYRVYVNDDKFVDYDHRAPCCDVSRLTISGDVKISELSVQDNIQFPYERVIPGGLNVGKGILVRGVAGIDPYRFALNFVQDKDNILLHFNPRFDRSAVILNSMSGGSWQKEEIPDGFPFVPGEMFSVAFYILEESYKVFVNGQYFADYSHRSEIENVNKFDVVGLAVRDIELISVEFLEDLGEQVIELPSGDGLKCCDSIRLRGFVKPDASRFHFNLREKSSEDTDCHMSSCDGELSSEPNISLHFNPREAEGQVVGNTKLGTLWGEEEIHALPKAFEQGQSFDVRVVVRNTNYQIFVNGEHYANYCHRLPFNHVKFVTLEGDAYFHDMQIDRFRVVPREIGIPGDGLRTGQWFIVSGVVENHYTSRFDFSLLNPATGRIVFCFNPRLMEAVVVRNSYNDGWEREERVAPYFPFARGEMFEIAVQVTENEFKTFVNGKHFVNFRHRYEIKDVTQLIMSGDAIFFKPRFF